MRVNDADSRVPQDCQGCKPCRVARQVLLRERDCNARRGCAKRRAKRCEWIGVGVAVGPGVKGVEGYGDDSDCVGPWDAPRLIWGAVACDYGASPRSLSASQGRAASVGMT